MAKSDFIIVSDEKSAPEASEHHGEIDWEKIDAEELKAQFAEYLGSAEATYGLIDQFMGAAQGQPGVAFGFRAGPEMLPTIIKFEDEKFYTGINTAEDSFAAVNGNDGDGDEDDLAIYPVGVGENRKGKKTVKAIVESLLKAELTEEDADAIAIALLGD